jgi:hypothetical protein
VVWGDAGLLARGVQVGGPILAGLVLYLLLAHLFGVRELGAYGALLGARRSGRPGR